MKPIHEQEWYLDAYGDVCRGKESLATHTNASPEEMRCMSAAPDMARALLADLEDHGGAYSSGPCRCAPCERRRTALRKAGVIS